MASKFALRRYQNALPATADFVQGSGTSTAQRSNVNVVSDGDFAQPPVGSTLAPDLHAKPWLQPVPVWGALFVALIIMKYAAERAGESGEFSSIRVGFWNFVTVFFMWLISATIAKWIFGYWRVPGLSALVLAA